MGPKQEDQRVLFGSPLRQTKALPLTLPDGTEVFHYYEAKVSYLMMGVDDFFFTSYLLVDTYQGETEDQRDTYDTAYEGCGIDPASMRSFEFPFWNPREHMFASLAERLDQVTKELGQMMGTFDKHMRRYVSGTTLLPEILAHCVIAGKREPRLL
jgi:hypothetical protein